MDAPEPTQSRNPGWRGRYLIYLGLAIGLPWLAAELSYRDCVGDHSRGDSGLCGLAYVVVTPFALAIVLAVLLGVEIVWWSRRSRRGVRTSARAGRCRRRT